IDEAHHFLVPSMSLLLSGARKYGIGLLASHQATQQITRRDTDILSGVMTNCYARVCFRSDTDAEKLAKGFSFFTAEHLKNLGVGEAICRFEQSRYDFNLKTFPLEAVKPEIAERRRKAVIEQTRKLYAAPKADAEAENQRWRQVSGAVEKIQPAQSVSPENRRNEIVKEIPSGQTAASGESRVQVNNGRGGRHHQELQAVVKRMAESYGFQVEIEKSVLEGTGFVDVALEKENLKIACEVSVTSTADYETKNVLKCLAAGYDYAVVVVSNQKKLPILNTKLRSDVPIGRQDKVKAFGLSGLLTFLRELAAPDETNSKKRERKSGQRLTLIEASEFLSISPSALYRWIREGRVPFYRVGREYRFDRDEIVLIGKYDLSGKRKASVKLSPLKIEKNPPKSKKKQDARYRKLLNLE
ncbi:MAG: helix-turn-helix domain-containing protein, partial [Pyrinomonadaceae bacterium]